MAVVGLATATAARAEGAWAPLGDHAVAAGLAGPRGAAVRFVGFSGDARTLAAVTAGGRVWLSEDLGASWSAADAVDAASLIHPERVAVAPADAPDALALRHPYRAGWIYALAENLYRSEDDGLSWTALTDEAAEPMIGANPAAMAFDPADAERIFVATDAGLWRSSDGGLSWVGLNAALPNSPAARFRGLGDGAPPWLELEGLGPALLPGGAHRWILAARPVAAPAAGTRATFEVFLAGGAIGTAPPTLSSDAVTALAVSGGPEPLHYAGMLDGRIWISGDGRRTWRLAGQGLPTGADRRVVDLWADPEAPSTAVAVFSGASGGRIFRTVDGGRVWDDRRRTCRPASCAP